MIPKEDLTDVTLVSEDASRNFTGVTDIDKSLDLEKFSKRNDLQISLSSWRNVFSSLVEKFEKKIHFLISIFRIFKKIFSFSS